MICNKVTKDTLREAIQERLQTLKEDYTPQARGNRLLADNELNTASAEGYSFDGGTFYDMFKVANDTFTGMVNWGNQAFTDGQTFRDTLIDGLGVSSEVAERMSREFRVFKKAVKEAVANQYTEGKQSSWSKPLGLIATKDADGNIEIPNEILFNTYVATMGQFAALQEKGFPSEHGKAMLLYSDPQVGLSIAEIAATEQLGTLVNDIVDRSSHTIAASLNIAPTSTDAKLYLARLSSALAVTGLLAIEQQGLIKLETITLDLEASSEGNSRNFEDIVSFKHILLAEDVTELQQTIQADITDYEKALGTSLDIDTPSQEPPTAIQQKAKGSIAKLSARIKDLLSKMQSVPWSKTKAFDLVLNLPLDTYNLLAGVVELDPDAYYQPEIRASIESKNKELERIRDLITEYNEAGFLDKFYIRHRVMRQLRLMQSGPMNAQASKVIRHIMAPASHRYQVTEQNEGYVQLAILQHLNQDPDKSALLTVIKPSVVPGKDKTIKGIIHKWNDMIADPVIQKAIKNYRKGDITQAVTDLHNSGKDGRKGKKYGSNMAVVAGLQALVEWTDWNKDKSKDWESTINYEIDGITNGYAIGQLQNPTIPNLEKGLNQTGTYLKEGEQHIIDGPVDDAYTEVGIILQKYLSNGAAIAKLGIESTKDITDGHRKFFLAASPRLAESLDRLMGKGLLEEAARSLAKDPFMVAGYGAGIKSIIAAFNKNLRNKIYEELGELQTEYNNFPETRELTIQRIRSLAATFSGLHYSEMTFEGKDGNKDSKNINYKNIKYIADGLVGLAKTSRLHTVTFSNKSIAKSDKGLVGLLKPVYEQAITSKLGGISNARDTLIEGLTGAFVMFEELFNKATAEYLSNRGVSGKKPELYENDINAILDMRINEEGTTLRDVMPKFQNPLTGDDTSIDLIDLVKLDSKTNRIAVDRKNGKEYTIAMKQMNIADAGVASYVRMIQSLDATILNSVLEQYPDVIPIYDAIIISPGMVGDKTQVELVHKALNDAYLDVNNKVNIFMQGFAILERLHRLGLRYETEEISSIDSERNLHELGLEVSLKKQQLMADGLHSNQYYSVDASQQAMSEAKEAQEELDKTTTLGSIQVDNSKSNYQEHITYTDLDVETQNLFDELGELSDKVEPHLQVILDGLVKPFKDLSNVTLTVGMANTITHGNYDIKRNHVGVSISRHKPKTKTAMSAQEVYVHELVHAISEVGLRDNAHLRTKLRHLRDEIKKALPPNAWEVFMPRDADGNVIYLTDPQAEIAQAKEMYEYVFNNTKDADGSEFLAYGLTNANLADYLLGRKVPTAQLNIRNNNFWGRLADFFHSLFQKFYRKGEMEVSKELVSIAMEARAINEAKKGYLSGFSQLVQTGSALMDMANKRIHNMANYEVKEFIRYRESDAPFFRVLRNTAGLAHFALAENALVVKARTDWLMKMNMRPLVNAIRSFMTGVTTAAELHRMNIKIKNVDTAREQTRNTYAAHVNDAFHPDTVRTDEHKAAETKVLLKTNFHAISGIGLSFPAQFDLIRNDTALEQETEKQYTLLGIKKGSRERDLIEGLGQYMALGHTDVPNIYTNSWGIHRNTRLDLDKIRALAAMESLKHVPRYTKDKVLEVIDSEIALDNPENGIYNLISLAADFERESLERLFDNNRWQMQDGYITQITDNLIDMQVTSNPQVRDKLLADGYTLEAPAENLGSSTDQAWILVHRNSPEVIRTQGLFSIQDTHKKGTSIGEIAARDQIEVHGEVIDGKLVHKAVRAEINRQNTLSRDGERKLIPLRNEKGKIVDMRFQMPHSRIEGTLGQDLKSDNVIGHMYDHLVAKQATKRENSKAVQLMYRDTKNNMKGREGWYVNILDPKYKSTTFDILPYDAQEEILALAKDGKFYTREDLLRVGFGYKMPSITDAIPMFAKQLRLAEHIWQKITSQAALNIIIKTPEVIFKNLTENVFTLAIKNIPPTYALPKMVEGLREIERYRTTAKKAAKLHITLKAFKTPANDPRWAELRKLKAEMKTNSVAPLINNGFFMAIAEDLDSTNEQGYMNRLEKKWNESKAAEHTPELIQTIVKEAFMTESTDTHKALRRAVQVSDFISRYALFSYRKEQGTMNDIDLIHEVDQTFINYNIPMMKSLQYMDSMGMTQFSRFWLRAQRVGLRIFRENPANLATGYMAEYLTGVDGLGIFNDTAWGGDFMPLYFRMDDVLFEGFDAQGIELANEFL